MRKVYKFSVLCLGFLVLFIACEEENESMVSLNFSTESHNTGQNCMLCHKEGGGGEGWFMTAGTVYDSTQQNISSNGNVLFSSNYDVSDELISEIEVDAKGNFYSTESINYGQTVYVGVRSVNGIVKRMQSAVNTGACNSCHGVSVEPIWVK